MSKISLKSSSSGTATFTIESPATNTDRTFNLPDSAGTVATAESTLAQFNVTGSAPVFACRAFVNFDGTTTPPTIGASGNVSSVTKSATGVFDITFATAMPDANYSLGNCVSGTTGGSPRLLVIAATNTDATKARVIVKDGSSVIDSSFVTANFFR